MVHSGVGALDKEVNLGETGEGGEVRTWGIPTWKARVKEEPQGGRKRPARALSRNQERKEVPGGQDGQQFRELLGGGCDRI